MSRYFDALNRLRRGRESAARSDRRLAEQSAEPATPAAVERPTAGPGLPFPELQLASRQASYTALLDLLRATSKASTHPAVVIAGVSGGAPVHEVVAGIALQASRQGIALKCGHLDLAAGSRFVQFASQSALQGSSPSRSKNGGESLRLTGSQGYEALSRWLERVADGSELLLIEAPPLNSSVEAALLGKVCGGVVLVAEALVTKRSALQESTERAQLAGCEVLGLVLTGTDRWLPRWIARLIDLFGRP